VGGGVVTNGNAVAILGSTIAKNTAERMGGLFFDYGSPALVQNSTISGNIGTFGFGGVVSWVPLTLSNSTIAFNAAPMGTGLEGAGLYSIAPLTLQSSIIADNVGYAGPSDLAGSAAGAITASSSSNLVTSSTLQLPPLTIQSCPQLQPLANNGGPTLTHALHHASAALDKGNNIVGLVSDQRLAPRIVNAAADIGAVEWQPSDTDERILTSGFDGLCDQ
jgi:hypothetical protein